MNAKKIRTAAAVVIALMILVYVGVSAFFAFSNMGIETETVSYGQVSDSLQAQGFAIRNETLVVGEYDGVISYRMADGTRVAKGGVIADVYQSEDDAAAWSRIERIDREVANLQALSQPADFYSSNTAAIGSQIYTSLNSLSAALRGGEFSQISQLKEDLQNALNRRQILISEETAEDFALHISELEGERAQLAASAGGAVASITAPVAGYFISGTDGLESVMAMDEVEDITPKEAKELLAQEPGEGPAHAVGKVCSDFNWYLVFVLGENDMVKLEDVEEVTLDIPFASSGPVPAAVVAKNRDTQTGETAVVLECSTMDSDLALVRNELIQINVRTYSGILVDEKALRFLDWETTTTDENGNVTTQVTENVKGVYVKRGDRLEFVQVFTNTSVNGVAVCRTELTEEERNSMVTENTIQLYDEVVVGGTNLYDGKIIQ